MSARARTHRPERRASYHHGDLRHALLSAATSLIAERGLEQVTLREAARRAGVSHNAPYNHFESRDALLAALAAQGFADLAQHIGAAGAGSEPLDAFIASAVAYVDFAAANPTRYRLMFGSAAGRSANGAPEQARATLIAMITRAQEAGLFGRADPSELAGVLWSLVHGLADLAIAGRIAQPVQPLASVAAAILARGLAS